jgi:hypothetical protein
LLEQSFASRIVLVGSYETRILHRVVSSSRVGLTN